MSTSLYFLPSISFRPNIAIDKQYFRSLNRQLGKKEGGKKREDHFFLMSPMLKRFVYSPFAINTRKPHPFISLPLVLFLSLHFLPIKGVNPSVPYLFVTFRKQIHWWIEKISTATHQQISNCVETHIMAKESSWLNTPADVYCRSYTSIMCSPLNKSST